MNSNVFNMMHTLWTEGERGSPRGRCRLVELLEGGVTPHICIKTNNELGFSYPLFQRDPEKMICIEVVDLNCLMDATLDSL